MTIKVFVYKEVNNCQLFLLFCKKKNGNKSVKSVSLVVLVGWTNLSLLSWFSNQEMNVVNESQQRLLSLPTQDHVKKDSIHIEALRLEFYLGFISLRTFVLYPVSQSFAKHAILF